MASCECIAIYSANFLVSYMEVIIIFLFQKALVWMPLQRKFGTYPYSFSFNIALEMELLVKGYVFFSPFLDLSAFKV